MARHINLLKDEANNAVDLYTGILTSAPEGMTLDVMKSRMSIIDKLAKANGKLVLEDAEWNILNSALAANKWPQLHPFIIQACDAVSDAEEKEAK